MRRSGACQCCVVSCLELASRAGSERAWLRWPRPRRRQATPTRAAPAKARSSRATPRVTRWPRPTPAPRRGAASPPGAAGPALEPSDDAIDACRVDPELLGNLRHRDAGALVDQLEHLALALTRLRGGPTAAVRVSLACGAVGGALA